MPLNPRRRTLLIGGSIALLAGCSGEDTEPEQTPRARRLRQRAAQESTTLLRHYDATLAAHPALADRLTPLRKNVAQHIKALGGGESGKNSTHTPDSPVPRDEPAAMAALAAAERRTADARTRALDNAPPELARLLASVAAAGGAHAYLLTEEP